MLKCVCYSKILNDRKALHAALLLKVLLADLLLAGGELGDVGVVALLHVLVGALQYWLLLQAGHGLLLLNTAQAGLGVLLAAAEVNPALEIKL